VIVRTFDGLQALTTPQPNWVPHDTSLTLYDRHQAYATIYATQPNVRICVDFLSRNCAQLAPHAFRRVSDTDRARLVDHELARWLGKPNPATRRYRLVENLMGDLGIYFEAYWLKVRYLDAQRRTAIGLVRLPPEEMHVEGGLLPSEFVWTSNGREKPFAPSEIVYFNGYNPCNKLRGLSPLETLRRILSEEVAAAENREQYWRNASRMEGIWELAKDAPNWTEPQQQSWRRQWQEFAGGGSKAGMTAVGPRGASYKPTSFSAKDSEYIQGGKLRREVCAAAYHIPQPMVGILEHATFSNIRAQHQHTYQDTLAPWLEMIQQEIEGQLLPECEDQENIYIEFNISEKLKGSFEEQVGSLHTATGRAFMSVNEARARMNLPRDPDPESDRIAPQQGGPSDASANPTGTMPRQPEPESNDEETAIHADRVLQAWEQRVHSRLARVAESDREATFFVDSERYARELAAGLMTVLGDYDDAWHRAARAVRDFRVALDEEAVMHG
jgi:HK97 family phage portal protein